MKRVIQNIEQNIVPLSKLSGWELVAYRCAGSDGYAYLTKISDSLYGFIPLNTSVSSPRFTGKTWMEAVALAAQSRTLYTFTNMEDMLENMYRKTF